MKALVYHGPGQRSWDTVPDPAIEEPTDAIVRIDSSTICGTDLHILKGDVPEVQPGTILGHEAVGIVVEVGDAVTTLEPGDRVLVSCISSCGRCRFCKEGRYGLCTGGGGWILGHLIDGLQAELARVPFADTSVYKLPDELSDEQVLFLADILPTAFEVGVLNGGVQPGDTVAIVGAGPIGLAAILTAKLFTPGRIVAIDPAAPRREMALEFGADVAIDNSAEDAVEQVMQLTGGLGADVAIEAVGVPETFELCAELVRPGGHVANVGVHGHPATLHLEKLWIRGVTIMTGLVDTYSTPRLLELIANGRLDATPFATHRFPLDETMAAYDTFAAAADTNALKVVLEAQPVSTELSPVKERRLALSVESRAAGAADVILKDGGTLRLRPPGEADADALLAFFEGLSAHSLYQRFHGIRTVEPQLAESLLDPDWVETGALAGWLGERVVGVANYVRLRDPGSAEVAFAVADEEQGRGIGMRLLEQLADRAAGTGVTRFVAEVLAENRAMLSVFTGAGFDVVRELDHGEVEVSFPIAATETFQARVEERDHVAVAASLRPFFEPRTVAVIGASRRRGSVGGELFRNVLEADFDGAAYPVNRGGEPVAGVRGYDSIAEIPDEIELAVICLPGPRVLAAADEALRKGVRALCVISSGFAETGAEGRERQEQLLALVRSHGARLLGPNCLGIASSKPKLNATFAPRALPAGRIGFSSQSGALGLALLEQSSARLGFSAFVSIGNKADVSSNDLLEWWEDDPETDLVLLYLESFGNPRKFGRLSRRVARRKPILALKAGATAAGAKAASSHTAALAGSEAAVDALFDQAGVLRARTLEELIDVAGLLSSQPLPHGRRVGVLTNAGGLGILCADACEASGLELPELGDATIAALRTVLPGDGSVANPVDMLGSATGTTYEQAIPPLLADPRLDALIVLFVPPVVAGAPEVAAAISRTVKAAKSDKPVLAVVMSAEGTPVELLESGVASFAYPESAARALGIAAERAEWLRRPAGSVPDLDGIDREAAMNVVDAAHGEWLDPAQTRVLLEAYGVPLVPERTAASADEAVAAAEEIGYPVVVKTAAAGAHKTETGGVALDLAEEAAVREAVERIGAPVLVQRYVKGGTELLTGVVQDPVFGPLVAFGPGGVFAELIGDAAFRLAPLTDVDAEELVTGGKAGRLVAGFRGAPAADVASLEDLVHRLGRLAEEIPEVGELDLNPVLAGPDGCVAVDARVRLRNRPSERTLKSW